MYHGTRYQVAISVAIGVFYFVDGHFLLHIQNLRPLQDRTRLGREQLLSAVEYDSFGKYMYNYRKLRSITTCPRG